MPDTLPSYEELPILRELRDHLAAAFHAREAAAWTPPPRRRRRRLLDGAAFALGLVAASGVAFVFLLGVGHRAPAVASPQSILGQAASAAERHPIQFPRDDQFSYLHSVATYFAPIVRGPPTPLRIGQPRPPEALVTIDDRGWGSATRDGLQVQRLLSFSFPTPVARQRWERLGRPSFLQPYMRKMVSAPIGGGKYLLGNIELTRRQLLNFPTQPRVLYQRLYAAGGSAKEVFTEITDTLRGYPVPAQLQAALYRTLALVPGIRYLGTAVERGGRAGTVVGMVQRGVAEELVIDPRTGEMIGERRVVLDARSAGLGLPNGTVTSNTAYLQRGVTDRLPNGAARRVSGP